MAPLSPQLTFPVLPAGLVVPGLDWAKWPRDRGLAVGWPADSPVGSSPRIVGHGRRRHGGCPVSATVACRDPPWGRLSGGARHGLQSRRCSPVGPLPRGLGLPPFPEVLQRL